MKDASSILTNVKFNEVPTPKGSITKAVPEKSVQVINQLFEKLKAIHPAWKTSFPTKEVYDQAKREWTIAFIENGIDDIRQLSKALTVARRNESPFFPSVGQFIRWCNPSIEDMGYKCTKQAFHEAMTYKNLKNANWSHITVQVAVIQSGRKQLSSLSPSGAFELFERNYQITCRRHASGQDLTVEIPQALPAEILRPSSKDFVIKQCKNIKKMFKNNKVSV